MDAAGAVAANVIGVGLSIGRLACRAAGGLALEKKRRGLIEDWAVFRYSPKVRQPEPSAVPTTDAVKSTRKYLKVTWKPTLLKRASRDPN